jgi:hypothetical protein
MLAQAMPTPAMDKSSSQGSRITATDRRPSAPHTRHSECVVFRPRARAIPGRAKENAKQTAEYAAKQIPAHSTPSR